MKKLLLILICITLVGCAAGYMTSYSYDPDTEKSTKTLYSPLFSSDSFQLAEGAEFRVSVVNEKIVEPASYGFLSMMGGLGSDDLYSSATVVVHFKNDSDQNLNIKLKRVKVLNTDYKISLPDINLKSGDRFSTKSIKTTISTYVTELDLELFYDLNGQELSKVFQVQRQTVEDLKRKKKKKEGDSYI